MYRRIALTMALALSVLSMVLMSSDSTGRAQKPSKATWDTGAITLGPNQILRISIVFDDGTGPFVRFRRIEYTQGTCESGVCAHQVVSDTTSAPVALAPGGGLSKDFYTDNLGNGVRGVVLSNSQDVRVTFLIINTATGAVVSAWDGDYGFVG